MTSKALAALMLQKAVEPSGFSNAEIEAIVCGRWARQTVRLETALLVKAGKVFLAQRGHNCRYFDTAERAASHFPPKSAKPPRKKRELKPVVIARTTRTPTVVKPPSGGPARMPGEPYFPTTADGSPAYKRTVAPPPPDTLYRSNTWSQL